MTPDGKTLDPIAEWARKTAAAIAKYTGENPEDIEPFYRELMKDFVRDMTRLAVKEAVKSAVNRAVESLERAYGKGWREGNFAGRADVQMTIRRALGFPVEIPADYPKEAAPDPK